MSIAVFWIQKCTSEMFPAMREPKARVFKDTQLMEALAFAGQKRTEEGCSHVCLHSELDDCVSLPGGSIIQDGKLPGGEEYAWKKRR